MALQLRPATRDDLPAITALYAREVREHTASWEDDAPGVEEMTRRFEALAARGLPYLVAELDGRFAGYAYASDYHTRAGYRWTVEDSV